LVQSVAQPRVRSIPVGIHGTVDGDNDKQGEGHAPNCVGIEIPRKHEPEGIPDIHAGLPGVFGAIGGVVQDKV
jgi:hypothetical protein